MNELHPNWKRYKGGNKAIRFHQLYFWPWRIYRVRYCIEIKTNVGIDKWSFRNELKRFEYFMLNWESVEKHILLGEKIFSSWFDNSEFRLEKIKSHFVTSNDDLRRTESSNESLENLAEKWRGIEIRVRRISEYSIFRNVLRHIRFFKQLSVNKSIFSVPFCIIVFQLARWLLRNSFNVMSWYTVLCIEWN